MNTPLLETDVALIDVLRKSGGRSVNELAEVLQVTATAVRQRLNRLTAGGLVERELLRSGRGRPSHLYRLTAAGRERAGANFGDLAIALWEEVREIRDPQVRRGLLRRLANRLAARMADRIDGDELVARMESLAELHLERDLPFEVDVSGDLPVVKAWACPYPGLAEQDRSICSMEKLLFSELLGQDVQLSGCRLDGEECCTFAPGGA